MNIINLVTELVSNEVSNKRYNKIKTILKNNYLDEEVICTMRFVKGEYTRDEEVIYLDSFSYLTNN